MYEHNYYSSLEREKGIRNIIRSISSTFPQLTYLFGVNRVLPFIFSLSEKNYIVQTKNKLCPPHGWQALFFNFIANRSHARGKTQLAK